MSEQPPITEKQWYYEKNGVRHGAVGEATLLAQINSGQLSPETQVWSAGMSGWVPAAKAGLALEINPDLPPPLHGSAVNNNIVWVLAFAPLISLFIEYMVALVQYDDEFLASVAISNMKYFYIPIALNVLLSLLDERKLRQAGHDTSHFKGWVWLVPVYLFQRAERLGHDKFYFATWVVCFLISLVR